jgi:hypothetical protein
MHTPKPKAILRIIIADLHVLLDFAIFEHTTKNRPVVCGFCLSRPGSESVRNGVAPGAAPSRDCEKSLDKLKYAPREAASC